MKETSYSLSPILVWFCLFIFSVFRTSLHRSFSYADNCIIYLHYLHHCLLSGESIVTLAMCVCLPSRLYRVSTAHCIILGGEGNALYPCSFSPGCSLLEHMTRLSSVSSSCHREKTEHGPAACGPGQASPGNLTQSNRPIWAEHLVLENDNGNPAGIKSAKWAGLKNQ